MRVEKDECCSCAVPAYPCMGDSCPNRHVARFYCDACGEESKLYKFDGEELCEDCILERLEVVEGSE